MTAACPSCGGAINYTDEDADRIEACPHCSARLTLPSSVANIAMPRPVRRVGVVWTLVKVVGLLLLIASLIWILLLMSR